MKGWVGRNKRYAINRDSRWRCQGVDEKPLEIVKGPSVGRIGSRKREESHSPSRTKSTHGSNGVEFKSGERDSE